MKTMTVIPGAAFGSEGSQGILEAISSIGTTTLLGRLVAVGVRVGVSVGGSVAVAVGVEVANRPESPGRLARCVQKIVPITPHRTTSATMPAIQRPVWLFLAGKGCGTTGAVGTGLAGGGAA